MYPRRAITHLCISLNESCFELENKGGLSNYFDLIKNYSALTIVLDNLFRQKTSLLLYIYHLTLKNERAFIYHHFLTNLFQ